MKNYFLTLLMSVFIVNSLHAQEDVEEVVVTSSLTSSALSEIEDPLHVVDGDELDSSPTQSLGESLDTLLGVSSQDYGAAVGQPVIRGMTGVRVRILNNGFVVQDVSAMGGDHLNEVDLNGVSQIEVVRGPSSLLYAKGTVGGVINIVDDLIAKKDFAKQEINLGLETQSVSEGDSQSFSYKNNIAGFNVNLAFKDSSFGNYDIPEGAVIHMEEEHHEDEDHDEDHDEEHEEHEEKDFLANSDFANTSQRIGISKTGDWGFVGFGFRDQESLFGLPYHVEPPGAHGEHGDHDDHGDEDDHDDHDEHGEERIFSTTDAQTFDIQGALNFEGETLRRISFNFRDTDFLHTEQHAEMEGEHDEHEEEEGHDEHGHGGPTSFTNDATEFSTIFDFGNDVVSRKAMMSFIETDRAVVGSEAHMNPVSSEMFMLGYYTGTTFDVYDVNFGFRFDKVNRKGSITHHEEEHHDDDHDEDGHEEEEHEEEIDFYDLDFNEYSYSFSLGREFSDNLSASVNFASVARAPGAMDLFMNGAHLARGRFEVGDPNLDVEQSNNVDISFNYRKDDYFGSVSIFRNNVDKFLYLQDVEEHHEDEDHDEDGHDEDEHEDEHDDHGGLQRAEYMQKDAEFNGYEFEFGRNISLGNGSLDLSFGRDVVNGKFADGTRVSRIVPARNIYTAKYSNSDNYVLKVILKDVAKQDNIGEDETVTSGFRMLDLKAMKTFDFAAGSELSVSVFANNILDEVARNHTSFVKNEVPLPGRNIGVRLKLNF